MYYFSFKNNKKNQRVKLDESHTFELPFLLSQTHFPQISHCPLYLPRFFKEYCLWSWSCQKTNLIIIIDIVNYTFHYTFPLLVSQLPYCSIYSEVHWHQQYYESNCKLDRPIFHHICKFRIANNHDPNILRTCWRSKIKFSDKSLDV